MFTNAFSFNGMVKTPFEPLEDISFNYDMKLLASVLTTGPSTTIVSHILWQNDSKCANSKPSFSALSLCFFVTGFPSQRIPDYIFSIYSSEQLMV
jgi:hypothetical protein